MMPPRQQPQVASTTPPPDPITSLHGRTAELSVQAGVAGREIASMRVRLRAFGRRLIAEPLHPDARFMDMATSTACRLTTEGEHTIAQLEVRLVGYLSQALLVEPAGPLTPGRSARRQALDLAVTYRFYDAAHPERAGLPHVARLTDLSAAGCRFVGLTAVVRQDVIELEFSLPEVARPFRLDGEVVRVEPTSTHQQAVAVAFRDVALADVSRLAGWSGTVELAARRRGARG